MLTKTKKGIVLELKRPTTAGPEKIRTSPLDAIDKSFSMASALRDGGLEIDVMKLMTSSELARFVKTSLSSHIARQLYDYLNHGQSKTDVRSITKLVSVRSFHKSTRSK